MEEIDSHLTLRTFLVGYTITIADIAVFGAIKGNASAFSAAKKPTYINLHRWFKYLESHETVARAVDNLRDELQSKKKIASSGSNFEIGLTNTDQGVVTRFPPEPSYACTFLASIRCIYSLLTLY